VAEDTLQEDDNAIDDIATLEAQFEALEIPSNIDPLLLALWMQRERDLIESRKRKFIKPPPKYGRSLSTLFPSYIGITVMCLTVILGLIQGQETTSILHSTCIAFLIYTIIGFFVGLIAERCVADSVESLLRDVVNRSRGTSRQSNPENGSTSSVLDTVEHVR
jgi:hypothetical protein